MRIVLWSFLVFVCSFILLLPLFDPTWKIPGDYSFAPVLGLLLLSLILQIEAIGYLKLKGLAKNLREEGEQFKAKNSQEKTSQMAKLNELEKSFAKEKELKKKLKQELLASKLQNKNLKDEMERHKVAQKDTQAKLLELEKNSKENSDSKSQQGETITLLSLMQDKGRLLDFLMDDISSYDDKQVGAASRIVHQGCHKVLKEYFEVTPLVKGEEGSQIKIQPDDDLLSKYHFVGNFESDQTPKQGVLLHKGWQTKTINLPKEFGSKKTKMSNIITPAEVEII